MGNQKQFDEIHEMVSFIKDNAVTKTEFSNAVTKTEFNELKDRVGSIESNMVTKDYLDKKLTDLHGDLVSLVRKEDGKVRTVIDLLTKKKVIDDGEANEIKHMEPFPVL